jgi:hypothetical protein
VNFGVFPGSTRASREARATPVRLRLRRLAETGFSMYRCRNTVRVSDGEGACAPQKKFGTRRRVPLQVSVGGLRRYTTTPTLHHSNTPRSSSTRQLLRQHRHSRVSCCRNVTGVDAAARVHIKAQGLLVRNRNRAVSHRRDIARVRATTRVHIT